MTAKNILGEWLSQTDQTSLKKGHYFVIEKAMKEYTKMKCKELLEIVVDKAQVEDFGYTVSSYSITNAVDLDEFVK